MEWKDIYKLPFNDSYIDGSFRSKRICDKKGNFVFQFINIDSESQERVLDILNGLSKSTAKDTVFSHEDGYILANDVKIIMIRGWGNLTGAGGHNLDRNDAAKVQDTFAEHIVELLNI